MSSSLLGDLSSLYPVVEKDLSDSGSIDCSIEFLMQAGGRSVLFNNIKSILRGNDYDYYRSLPEAVMTVVPEAWQNDPTMPEEKRDFYR